jgi:hypothetical protein
MAPVFVGLIIVSQRGVLRLPTRLPCAPAQGWRWSRIARTLNPQPWWWSRIVNEIVWESRA